MKVLKSFAFLLIAAAFILVVMPSGNDAKAIEKQGIEVFNCVDVLNIDLTFESTVVVMNHLFIFNEYAVQVENNDWYCSSNRYVRSYGNDNTNNDLNEETCILYGSNYLTRELANNYNLAIALKNQIAIKHNEGSEVFVFVSNTNKYKILNC